MVGASTEAGVSVIVGADGLGIEQYGRWGARPHSFDPGRGLHGSNFHRIRYSGLLCRLCRASAAYATAHQSVDFTSRSAHCAGIRSSRRGAQKQPPKIACLTPRPKPGTSKKTTELRRWTWVPRLRQKFRPRQGSLSGRDLRIGSGNDYPHAPWAHPNCRRICGVSEGAPGGRAMASRASGA